MSILTEMMLYGVPSNINHNIHDYISREYPLSESFHLDNDTTKIMDATLDYSCTVLDQEAKDTEITFSIDGKKVDAVKETQGNVDLSKYVTAPGWHKITIGCNTMIDFMGCLYIRSYVRVKEY